MTVYRNASQDERQLNRGYSNPPVKKKKPKPAPTAAQDERVLAKPGPAPAQPQPPSQLLQTYGFQGSTAQFVDNLRRATEAHVNAFGYKPSPGFAFDLARWQGQWDYDKLFGGNPEQLSAERDQETERRFLEAARSGDYADFLEENPDIQDLLKRKPALGVRAAGLAIASATPERLQFDKPQKQLLGVDVEIHNPIGETLWRAGSQITDSLVHAPGGIYESGKATGKDLYEAHPEQLVGLSFPGKRDRRFKRTQEIGKGIAKQTVEDFRHPLRNPGYLFLDLLGLTSAGGGTVARISAATKATGVKASAKALVRRPEPGTFTISKGGTAEEVLLSENAAVRAVQRQVLKTRQKGMARRHEVGPGTGSVLIPQRARDFLQKHFSLETKLGREARARMRYEHTLAMDLKRELDAVAGRSITQARVFSRMPKPMRAGLSRGEQKAIQVLSWDDPNPLQAERSFHERMIEQKIGDPKAHKRQLADLKLAEKVLKNPSKRFEKALALTRQVIAEQERIKVETLGLDPVTAEKRVIASGEALRGEPLREGGRQNPESFYLPQIPKGKTRRPPYDRIVSPRIGPGGIPPVRDLPELRHVYEGKAIQAGDIRIDATGLAGEAYARTVRAASIKNDYNRLWSAATDKPQSIYDRPIRDVTTIPDKLRALLLRIDEGRFTAKDAEALTPDEVESIHKSLYPSEADAEGIKGVKWVDSRLMGNEDKIPQVPGPFIKGAQYINEPFRDIILYLRPAYILNLLGNAGMGLIHQGPFLPANVVRAMNAKRLYGAENMRTMEALVGEGKAKSFVAEGASPRPGRALAAGWSRITDRDLRMSALERELRRKYHTTEKIKAALASKDKGLVEAARRANKAMVEFDNLTWYEKNYLRHFIFVYPWVSRSAVWSVRTIMEHPIKTGVLSHLGRMSEEDMDPYLKHAPEWFKRTGYFPVGWEGDKPKLVNPTSVNSFATIGELLVTAEAGVTDTPYAATEDLLGPFASFMLHGLTGRDDFGNEYPDGDWVGAARQLISDLPHAKAIERAKQKTKAPRKVDITDRGTLAKRERAALEQTVFSPGWLDGYGSLIVGGLSPRLYDPDAAAARYWKDQPLEARHKHEMGLIRKALDLQAEFLDRKLPEDVSRAVNFAGARELQYKLWQRDNGRDPTLKERTQIDIDLMVEKDRITDREAKDLRAKLKRQDETTIKGFRGRILELYADANALHDWDEDVRWVASFKPKNVHRDVDFLRKAGLFQGVQVNDKDLPELGRRTLEFRKEAKRRAKELDREDLDEAAMRQLRLELAVWEAEADKPINIDGRKYPSPVRIAWARMPASQRQETLDSAVTGPWKGLSPFEKELMGKKVDPKTARGWQVYDDIATRGREALQGQTAAPGSFAAVAKWVEKYGDNGKPVPGFYKDWLFDKKPLVQRMQVAKPILQSENKDTWKKVFLYANGVEAYLHSDAYKKTDVRRTWKAYVEERLYPWLASDRKFKPELDRYGGLSLLQRLVN